MHANRMLIYQLVGATIAVDLLACGFVSRDSVWPNSEVAVVLGLAAGQINLSMLWGALGQGYIQWRLAILVVVPGLWGLAVAQLAPSLVSGYASAAAWVVHFLAQSIILVSALLPVRFRGAHLSAIDWSTVQPSANRSQFTIRYLFAWLTATAIVLSVATTISGHAQTRWDEFDWRAILVLGFCNAMTGLILTMSELDSRVLPRRLATILVITLAIGAAIAFGIVAGRSAELAALLLQWFYMVCYSSVALAVLRVGGYRVVWTR